MFLLHPGNSPSISVWHTFCIHHPTKSKKTFMFHRSGWVKREKKRKMIFYLAQDSAKPFLYPLQMIIVWSSEMYQSNCFPTITLLSTSKFSHILVLVTNYSKISNADILSHMLIQKDATFSLCHWTKVDWHSLFWNRANRTQPHGVLSYWEHT